MCAYQVTENTRHVYILLHCDLKIQKLKFQNGAQLETQAAVFVRSGFQNDHDIFQEVKVSAWLNHSTRHTRLTPQHRVAGTGMQMSFHPKQSRRVAL